jgi:hypothetical protein
MNSHQRRIERRKLKREMTEGLRKFMAALEQMADQNYPMLRHEIKNPVRLFGGLLPEEMLPQDLPEGITPTCEG